MHTAHLLDHTQSNIHHPLFSLYTIPPSAGYAVITLDKMRLALAYILGLVLASVSAGPFTNPAPVRSC